ncbi:MAG: DUF3341 domain-containing protein [Bdellovibrionales bacterium]|nr:DUF3341 domain-containing protein [Bdellovibrionales bacterium]
MLSLIETIEDLLRPKGQRGVAGIWLDEHQLVAAAAKVRQAGFSKTEAISPFPIHGIDEALGLKLSWIPWVTFIFGLGGATFGTWFTWWTSAVNYPLIIAGKPYWSLPAFIPIIFECTILFAALSSVAALFAICGLPKVDPPVIDPDLTCSKFALFIPESDKNYDAQKIEQLFKSLGAESTKHAEF